MRPILRPGTHVLRRAGGEPQVGLDPGTAVVLPDREDVHRALGLLASCADLAEYPEPATVELLRGQDLLLDQKDLMPLLAAEDVSPHATAAVARSAGPGAPAVHASRRGYRLECRSFGHPVGAGLAGDLVTLAARAGIRAGTARGTDPRCGLLVGVGEPDRELLDPWTREETPYLVVRLTEGRAVLGPFVAPGRTACLRCIDAHCCDADPSWPLLVRQYAAAASRDRADGAPEPLDPLLAAVAVAWAARDLASYVDGLRPSTWSATVTLHPHLGSIETCAWLRHPGCGCSVT
jgi:bacteriocin biosynthesis cyclodehydratase domain-containing protein